MDKIYNELRHYGVIVSDKNHETTEGHYIRFTCYKLNDRYYVVTMFDGSVIMVTEKDDIEKLLKNA
jgi:hypothetical protein